VLGSGTLLNDRYLLVSRVGGGGMGEVWRADDTVLGRAVAVKVLAPALTEDPTFVRRFQNEARAMATLRHPGIVDVYDYGVAAVGGRQVSFLVMEFVAGESLDRVLRRTPLDAATTMRLVADVAGALAAAHEQGIVHRDVKPANLMIRAGGGVVLTDFGIAHSASAGQLTATGAMLCSAGYCAPEMANGGEVTPAADLYALGVVAYECLTGRLPYEGDSAVQIIYKHLHAPVPALSAEVPSGARQVVARALEKAPERRWLSAAQMAGAATRAMAAPRGPAARHGRRALPAALAVMAAILVTLVVAGSIWMRPQVTTGPGTILPPVHETSAQPATSGPVTGQPVLPVTRNSTTPRHTGRHTPTATATVTVSPSGPAPTRTPPTHEPEPTTEPTTPPPTEQPTPEPTPPPTEPQGEIQCIRAPCHT
jgi:serine/threonine-protein kinase